MAISDFYCSTSYWKLNWQIYPQVDLPVDLNGNFRFLLLDLIWADQLAYLSPQVDQTVYLNGNLRFSLFELILEDQLADLPPGRSASGSEWQFQIFIVRAHMGRSTGRSTPPWVDLPVHLNDNFTFLLSELILALHICHFTHCCSKDIVIKDLPFHRCLHRELRQTRWQIYPHPPSTGI